MEINCFYEDIEDFEVNKKYFEQIEKACSDEGKKGGAVNFIFCSDIFLLNLNKDYLNHNYFTDIITFDYSEEDTVSGDVFISKERVEDNARKFKVSPENELNRVMVHGILHLIGYNDSTDEEKQQMRLKEEQYMI